MTEEAAPQAEAPAAPQWAPEVEAEARALGWKSPDEWAGEKKPGFIDTPERFIERANSFAPVQKLTERLATVETKAEERLRKMEAALAKTFERQHAELKAQLEQVKAEKVQAVEVGDVDRFKALERREDTLRKAEREAEAPQAKPDAVPEAHKTAIDNWRADKSWFQADPVKTQAAVILYGKAQKDGMTDPQAILRFVDTEMAKQFRDLAPATPSGAAVEAGLTFGGPAAAPFDKLPAEAKATFKRFVEKGLFTDTKEGRATYAEYYNAA